MNKLGILFKLFTFLVLCQISFASGQSSDFELADRYVANHSEIAISEMIRTGVPASIKLAQGMLESDWGRSELATVANNHFGIKCGNQWQGGTFYKEDDDRDKKGDLIQSCFRSFKSTHDSYIAHSDFLADPNKSYRYGFLFDLETIDYKSWANGLQKAGYATDKKYPKKLIQLIEKYELHRFDVVLNNDTANTEQKILKIVDLNEKTTSKKVEVSSSSAGTLQKGKINDLRVVYGDGNASIKQIAEVNRRSVKQILKFNEVFSDENYIPKNGMAVYLQRKRSMTNSKYSHHTVYEGDTMASIAHQYGLKLKSLYTKNRMPIGSEPLVGEKLNLYRQVSASNRPKYIDEFGNGMNDEKLLFLDDPDIK